MPSPLRVAFLGCGFITEVHSRQFRSLRGSLVPSYASRDAGRRLDYCRRHRRRPTYRDLCGRHRRPAYRCRRGRGAAEVPPRPDPPGARRGQTRARGKAGVPLDGRLRAGARRRATGPDASCWSARTTTTSRWRSAFAAWSPSGAIGDLVFAHFATIARRLKIGRRLAQRRGHGRRVTRSSRRASTGCTSRAASGPQSPASRATGRRRRRTRPGSPRQEHDGRLPLR